ncbi:MAG: DUF4426 domain-containing protein [Hahellaceae bacterium]|nr:DUF4426 domain-containing protein [Hahellaceae bacterium]MCP5168417.1 DUF4426 domain-containing protein [Hahellaceae bacterium]
MMLVWISNIAQAEQKEDFGAYEVHYSAFNSTFLSPEVAKQYDIVRSKAIGVINISVLKKVPGKLAEPVAAQIEGIVSNDIQQQVQLPFHRVTEGRAIYYIAEFQFAESELLTFNVTSHVNGESQPMKIRFVQNFYNN